MPLTRARAKYKATAYSANVTIGNTTTEGTLFTATLPPMALTAGKTYRITARGLHGTLAAAAGNLYLRVSLGSTVVATTANATLTANLLARVWEYSADITVLSTGVTGSVDALGFCKMSVSSTAAAVWEIKNTTPVTINTTVAQDLKLLAKFTVADVANTITFRYATIEEMGG